MTKLELTISATSFECVSVENDTAALLGAQIGSPVSALLADENELLALVEGVRDLMDQHGDDRKSEPNKAFATLDLVFRMPELSIEDCSIDRSPIQGVFRSPIRAIHTSGVTELSCFAHIELLSDDAVRLTAIEFSRKYREQKIRQEFGSWLLEEHIESAVIATDPIGTVVFWNRFASDLYQYSKEDAMGRSIMELTPSEMTQEQGMEIFTRLQKGEHWRGFFGVKRKDGSRFIAHVTDTPVLNQNEELKFIVGVSADYSQMHDLMNELKTLNLNLEDEVATRTRTIMEQEKSLRMVGAAVQESDTGVVITDDNFRIVWYNQAVTRYILNGTEIENEYPWDLPLDFQLESTEWERDDPETHRAPQNAKRFFESGNRGQIYATAQSRIKDEMAFLSVTVQSMPDSKNYVVVFRDLTAERNADEARRQVEKEAAASRAKTEMMCMLSHEFRTPLQGIMGVVSTSLLDFKEGSPIHEQLSTIAASSKLLLTLINNVLDLGKIEADMMQELELASMAIDPSIRDAIVFCQHFAMINEVKVTLEHDLNQLRGQSRLTVLANRLRVEQILINLLSNAIKYTGMGTEVTLGIRRCSASEAYTEALTSGASDLKLQPRENAESLLRDTDSGAHVVVLTIRDQGRGIPDEEMGLLFQEFTQLQVSKDEDSKYGIAGKLHAIGQSSGSGLGLSLVLKFLRLMGGHIWVKNNAEGGACFSICFPEGDPLPSQASSTVREISSSGNSESRLSRPDAYESMRVLLVDDSVINLKVLERMLHRLGVRDVVAMSSASDAVDALQAEKDPSRLPSLILSDLQMPGMDGYGFIAHLREMAHFREPPIVMACTADWSPASEKRCVESGFDGVLHKPIVLSGLDEFLSSVVRGEFPRAEVK